MTELLVGQLFDIGPLAVTMAHAFVVVGALLVINEAFVPGANSMVFGIGLLVSGLIGMATGIGMHGADHDVFLLSLIALVVGGGFYFVYRRMLARPTDQEHTTSDSQDLRGKNATVIETVTPESGRVRLRGVGSNPEFQARTEHGEIPQGEKVTVIDPGGGSVLIVESTSDES